MNIMSFEIKERKTPKGTKYIKFNFKDDPKFGMINLGTHVWKKDIDKIENINEKIIDDNIINIYFPIFDHFYMKTYESKNGYTFKKLFSKIMKTGIEAGKYDTKHNPDHYAVPATYEDFVGEYAITSNDKESDIEIKNNNIYISLQH